MDAWIFDVDGVITDPITKKADHAILKYLSQILKDGNFLSLNTGRSLSWVNNEVLNPLEKIVLDKDTLKNMFVVCEKGNVLAWFENGKLNKKILDDSLPENLEKKIKELVEKNYSNCMFFDESKETMISIEMNDNFDMDLYSARQKELKKQIEDILLNEYRDLELITDTNQIALDIQYEDAGKHLGAERIEDFILEKGIKPNTVYMLGDSSSDVEMAKELEQKYNVIFVFTNDKEKLKDTPMCEVVYTKEKFTKGTIEFLDNNLKK